jgi:glutamate/tyrosine decarboxylase-like PLP-dependent enzyme
MNTIPPDPEDRRKASESPPLNPPPIAPYFLGPKAEHADIWQKMFDAIFQDYAHWRRNYFPGDPAVTDHAHRREHEEWYETLKIHLDSILGELKAHFPFYSQRYLGHMLSEQTLPSVLGYYAGMLYNPNNVTDEAAPVTVRLELEVGKMVAEMIGYNPRRAWAHICSGGTVANLEALWVARNVQFTPLVVQEYCKYKDIVFEVETPNGAKADIEDLSPSELLGLKSSESIGMIRKLAEYLIGDVGQSKEEVLANLTTAVKTSAFNPAIKGMYNVLRAVQLTPVIYVSAAAHYSIRKAANVLGYGEESVCPVPVTERFRMDVQALYDAIRSQQSDRYIAAVVGIAGTTEEGAVDPLHQIHFMQLKSCRERNRSFWLHIDAAWGGYVRSLFCGHSLPDREGKVSLETICDDYARAINATETCHIHVDGDNFKNVEVSWNDAETYKAFLAMGDADSITIDPHKMGYVPYPAGIIAFKNQMVTELMTQKAQYISDECPGIKDANQPTSIQAVGPYVLEGSKPGAAAAGCWLAHTAIPLTFLGHGQIIKASLLSARKLNRYLLNHRHMFRTFEDELFGGELLSRHPFTFVPLYEPDTNVILFAAVPMSWQNKTLVPVDMALARVNALNKRIYQELSIPGSAPKTHVGVGKSRMPYGQSYFVSRTRLEESQYSFRWIAKTLDRLGISEKEYKAQGLFVLRAVVMNPLYQTAESEGKDYLLDFVRHLHQLARAIVPGVCWSYEDTGF